MRVIPQSKQCSACKEIKLATEFYRDARNKSGLCSQCRSCAMLSIKRTMAKKADEYKAKHAVLGLQWARRNSSKLLQKAKTNRENIGDSYLRAILKGNYGFRDEEITNDLLHTKRQHIFIKRLSRELKETKHK